MREIEATSGVKSLLFSTFDVHLAIHLFSVGLTIVRFVIAFLLSEKMSARLSLLVLLIESSIDHH